MTRIVMDVDTGIDDTLALAYVLAAVRAGECELAGVVGTYGNVLASTAMANNRAVLRLFDAAVPGGTSGVPTPRGCVCPSWADGFAVDEGCARFHGDNGLGNVDPTRYGDRPSDGGTAGLVGPNDESGSDDAPTITVADRMRAASRPAVLSLGGERHDLPVRLADGDGDDAAQPFGGQTRAETMNLAASDASYANRPSQWRADCPEASRPDGLPAGVRLIIDEVRAHGRDVTVLATGPLTDVDAALAAAPDIAERMRLVMMGGALTQEGNCYDLICETNIFQDPEAANRVFRSGADVTMIGLDVTHQCLLTRADAESWRAADGPREDGDRPGAGAFLADMARFYIGANEASDPLFLAGSPLHDPLAAAVALDPALVTCFDVNMMTETSTGNGHGFRGRTIGDPTRLRDPRKTAHVALNVDAARAAASIRDRIGELCANNA
ncbi:Inosine-uridine preferring nucleoside hydrolase [Bifidobacterium sp. DSM 109958]|uniref:Inosine-uridine preferring nucleoside hydrolase n=2 Tax=Bifidobacterium moraviense TaxID=2675323 RepID=A0A7Y0HZA6_9BIFI|nr:Inosine-uridine preferring nucleoside hydrolase [Bifidobacterium sp. DSM 109958]